MGWREKIKRDSSHVGAPDLIIGTEQASIEIDADGY
jgi:hypothetical protein